MRITAIAVVLASALVVFSFAEGGNAGPPGARENPTTTGPGLIALGSVAGDYQQVAVIDPQQRVMSVYHVELKTGKIELKSVRNITWDMRIEQYNSTEPLPEQIRSLLEPD